MQKKWCKIKKTWDDNFRNMITGSVKRCKMGEKRKIKRKEGEKKSEFEDESVASWAEREPLRSPIPMRRLYNSLKESLSSTFQQFLVSFKRNYIGSPQRRFVMIFVYEEFFSCLLKIRLLSRWEIPKLNYVRNVELKAVKRNVGLENAMFEVRDDYTLLTFTWTHRQNVGCTSFLIESNSYGEMGCEHVTRSLRSFRIAQVKFFYCSSIDINLLLAL